MDAHKSSDEEESDSDAETYLSRITAHPILPS